MKIGELARRTGVSVDLLRAWERRYGLLQPRRTAGNQRLYSALDQRRVQLMLRHIAAGRSAAQSAELTCETRLGVPPGDAPTVDPREVRRAHAELRDALARFEETTGQRVLEGLLMTHAPLAVLRDVVLPFLRGIDAPHGAVDRAAAAEHFAHGFFEARLLALARGWDRGTGPRAVLACPPGERHSFGLIGFGIALHALGWRMVYLGADTPIEVVRYAADRVSPALVVLAATTVDPSDCRDDLQRLGREWPCLLSGPAARRELADRVGARVLSGDPVSVAFEVGG